MRHERNRTTIAAIVVLTVLALFGAGCGKSTAPRDKPSDDGRKVTGKVTVFAAASLTEAFSTLEKRFEKAHPGAKVTLNFGASSELVDQIGQGAPADILATADTKTMKTAVDAGKVGKPQTFARNRLAILVAPGNPKHIKTLADLADPGVAFVLCAPEVPCGKFGARILARAKVAAEPKSFEENVKAVVNRVVLGEADAGLVYVSDVKAAGAKAEGVNIPDAQNTIATYPIAVAQGSSNGATARAFVAYVRSAAGQRVLAADGFLPANG